MGSSLGLCKQQRIVKRNWLLRKNVEKIHREQYIEFYFDERKAMKQANITTHACFHCFECFSTLFLLEVLFFLKTILICIIRKLWLICF